EREGIEDSRLAILRIARGERLHRLLIALGARAMVDGVVILVEDLDGGDVIQLALRLGAHRLALGNRGGAQLEILAWWRASQRIAETRHGAAPVGDAARRVGLGGGFESRDRMAEPERVEQSHRACELLLRSLAAGRWEIHHAESLGNLLRPGGQGEEESDGDGDGK